MKTTLLTPRLQNKCQPGVGCPKFPGLSLLCWRSFQDVLYTKLLLWPAPPHQHSSLLLPCWKQNENYIWSKFFQGEQAHMFNYINFTLVTFTALLERSFITSSVLGSVGAVAVFVPGVNCAAHCWTSPTPWHLFSWNHHFSAQCGTNIQLKSFKSFLPEVGSKPLFLAQLEGDFEDQRGTHHYTYFSFLALIWKLNLCKTVLLLRYQKCCVLTTYLYSG